MESHYICPFRYRLELCIKEFTKKCPDTDHTEISLGSQFKLEPHPHWSPLGVLFEFSDEHPLHLYMGSPLERKLSDLSMAARLVAPFWYNLHSLSLTKIIRPKGTREREEVRKTLKYLDSNNEPFKTQVKMNDQIFQWSGLGAQNVVRKCSYCQEHSSSHFCLYLPLYTFSPYFVGT